jgi:hypothetical protein
MGEDTPNRLELKDNDQIDCFLERPGDIGIFGAHANSMGIEYLDNNISTTTTTKPPSLLKIIHHINANPFATYQSHSEQEILQSSQRKNLIQILNDKWNGKDRDLKVLLTNNALSDIIGRTAYTRLARLTGGTHDTILLRRCAEHNNVIKFHTDESYKTLQVPLNNESEYEGGKLVYITTGRGNAATLHFPKRPAGSFTLHGNDIAHGVTRLVAGVRYGLFLLQKKEAKSES